jgi:hypothetical protein
MSQLRFRIRALIAVTACVLIAPLLATGPAAAADAPRASKDEVGDALNRAIAATTQHAVDVGGYRVDHSWRWPDGSSAEWWEAFEANGSKEVHLRYAPAAGPKEDWHFPWQWVHFVADSEKRTWSDRYRYADAEDKEALRIMKAPLEGWMLFVDTPWRSFPGLEGPNGDVYFVGSMRNWRGAAGQVLDGLVRGGVDGGDVGSSGRIYAEVDRRGLLYSRWVSGPYKLTVELGSGGQVSSIELTTDEGLQASVRITYAADLVAQPTGPDVVTYETFVRAQQSTYMADRLYDIASDTRIESVPATPRSLMAEAKRQVAEAYEDGWRIPVRLIRVKLGVRFQAKNPFTGEKLAYDLILGPPTYAIGEISGLIRPRTARAAP